MQLFLSKQRLVDVRDESEDVVQSEQENVSVSIQSLSVSEERQHDCSMYLNWGSASGKNLLN